MTQQSSEPQPSKETVLPTPSPGDMAWLMAPEASDETGLFIRGVLEASQLTPQVLQALGRAMEEIQKSVENQAKAGGSHCPHFQTCGTYVSPDCVRLTK